MTKVWRSATLLGRFNVCKGSRGIGRTSNYKKDFPKTWRKKALAFVFYKALEFFFCWFYKNGSAEENKMLFPKPDCQHVCGGTDADAQGRERNLTNNPELCYFQLHLEEG